MHKLLCSCCGCEGPEELECVFNANAGREDIFKPTIWNERLHKIYNDNGVVSFATSKS
jgi:hypothetical protein